MNKLFFVVIVFSLAGCANRFYFKKNIDIFNPVAHDTYTVSNDLTLDYSNSITNKLITEFNKIPMTYESNPYTTYVIHFYNQKRLFVFPVFQITVIKKTKIPNTTDQIVYNSLVYSYNFNVKKSLIASLSIISHDVLDRAYSRSQFVSIKKREISRILEERITNYQLNNKVINNKERHQQHQQYKLYDYLKIDE